MSFAQLVVLNHGLPCSLCLVCICARIYLNGLVTESLSLWNVDAGEQMAKGPCMFVSLAFIFQSYLEQIFIFFPSATCHIQATDLQSNY